MRMDEDRDQEMRDGVTDKGRKREKWPGGVHKWGRRGTGEANLPQKLSLRKSEGEGGEEILEEGGTRARGR